MSESTTQPPSPTTILDYAAPGRRRLTPVFKWLGMLIPSFIAQLMFLPCLCYEGPIKMNFALILDLLFIARGTIAICIRERRQPWLFYGVIIFSSAFWIEPILHSPLLRSWIK